MTISYNNTHTHTVSPPLNRPGSIIRSDTATITGCCRCAPPPLCKCSLRGNSKSQDIPLPESSVMSQCIYIYKRERERDYTQSEIERERHARVEYRESIFAIVERAVEAFINDFSPHTHRARARACKRRDSFVSLFLYTAPR